MSKRAVILLPGEIKAEVCASILTADDYIIAVDGGIEQAINLNIQPHLWIGDFDSCLHTHHDQFKHLPKETFSVDKDLLDSELAIQKAIEMNIKTIIFIGGTGGRVDHQLTLLLLPLAYPTLSFQMLDGMQHLYSICDDFLFNLNPTPFLTLSITPLTVLPNVTLTGVKWPLKNAKLTPGSGWSMSNQVTSQVVQLYSELGMGWIILSSV